MPPPRVLGLGSACLDTLIEVERSPRPGGKVRFERVHRLPGGQIASPMVGCVRLGLRASLLLRTGDDEPGERIRMALQQAGVGLEYASIRPGVASATSFILIDRAGERTIVWNAPAGLDVQPEEIPHAIFADAEVLFFDGHDAAASLRAAQLARQHGVVVVADFDRRYPHTAELFEWVDHLVVPADSDTWQNAPCTVVLTEGAAGARGREPGREWVASPAFRVPVVDTTGAGDAFHCGYIYALLQNWNLERRLRFANATAALACGAFGSQAGLPSLSQVEKLLAEG